MKREVWNESLNHIDADIIENYVEQKDKYIAKNKEKECGSKIGAIAACFCIIASAIVIPFGFKVEDPLPHYKEEDEDIILPSISLVSTDTKINGKTYLKYELNPDSADSAGSASSVQMAPDGFYVHTVVQANVIEVLPDVYFSPQGGSYKYHIARLEIVDSIIGDKMPREINFRYSGFPINIFDAHDTFILSLDQIGIENYMMINETQNEVSYFSDMFKLEIDNLLYGSVIPFKDGRVDYSFGECIGKSWRFSSNLKLWIREDSIEAVKNSIIELSQNENDGFVHLSTSPDYVTAEDIFAPEECQKIKNYLEPNESNIFMHSISVASNYVSATYTRVINGFDTDEKIVVKAYSKEKGSVQTEGAQYTPEELSRMPNIGEVLEGLNLDEIYSSRIDTIEGIDYKRVTAKGFYRKSNGNVYGIVQIMWWCEFLNANSVGYEQDARYYLYDAEGNGKVVKVERLEELFGGNWFIP